MQGTARSNTAGHLFGNNFRGGAEPHGGNFRTPLSCEPGRPPREPQPRQPGHARGGGGAWPRHRRDNTGIIWLTEEALREPVLGQYRDRAEPRPLHSIQK